MKMIQNGSHSEDDIIEFIFLGEDSCISIWVSLKFVPIVIDNSRFKNCLLQIQQKYSCRLSWSSDKQSGTKPNLVVKFWLPTLVSSL